MGTAALAPPAAPAVGALVAEAGGPAAAALGAAGPPGWIAAAVGAVVAVVVVAGDEKQLDRGCWKVAIGNEALSKLDEEKIAFHTKHGMLLPHVLEHCESLTDEDGKLVLKNSLGEHFGLSITHVTPIHETDFDYEVILAHAVPVPAI